VHLNRSGPTLPEMTEQICSHIWTEWSEHKNKQCNPSLHTTFVVQCSYGKFNLETSKWVNTGNVWCSSLTVHSQQEMVNIPQKCGTKWKLHCCSQRVPPLHCRPNKAIWGRKINHIPMSSTLSTYIKKWVSTCLIRKFGIGDSSRMFTLINKLC
jgi:hypothetical protein